MIVVDDRFPFDEERNTWAFSRTGKEPEIWVLLLEKVWAKLFGSYQRIEAGTTGEALAPLTGCPTQYFIHDNIKQHENFWKSLMQCDERKMVMCTAVASMAGEKNVLDSGDMKRVGLVDAHAYSLLGVCEVKLKDGSIAKLCHVRNPWGKKEWNGAWSDNSKEWDEHTIA